MKTTINLTGILCLLLPFFLFAQDRTTYFDGPYAEVINDSLNILWIEGGEIRRDKVLFDKPYHFNEKNLPQVTINPGITNQENFQRHEHVPKFVALSDIHGQHELFIRLLEAHQVVDSLGQWTYDNGHLVIVGDMMDRGDKVLETLWFLYDLEKQAEQAGGKIHVLLGNHELMVMHGDLGYLHPKYRFTSGISRTSYPDFFKENTILGNWLRSKNIATVINNIGFVHGGFSLEVLKKESSLDKINNFFKETITPNAQIANQPDELTSLLYFDNGPLWYRGYADPDGFDRAKADSILLLLNLERIVVGHTSMPQIVATHENKILLIDSSIKFGKSGEVLIYENGTLYRGLLNGKKEPISEEEATKKSPFQYLQGLKDTNLSIVLDTDLKMLMRKNKMKEIYQDANLLIVEGQAIKENWPIKIRTRGNMRKKVCRLPPMKIDFPERSPEQFDLKNKTKLKLVFPCGKNENDQQALYLEHLIYQLYQAIDTNGYVTHLANLTLKDKGKTKYDFIAFFIEDKHEYAARNNCKILADAVINHNAIERSCYLKMVFFQYLILNTDFNVRNKHNLTMIALPGESKPRVIPYDFDYAGMVDQPYAVPHNTLPIKEVRDPFFMGKKIERGEVAAMKNFFNSKRPELEAIVNNADYLTTSSKNNVGNDMKRFYDILNNEKTWSRIFKVQRN